MSTALLDSGPVFADDGRFVELGAQFLHGKSDVFDIAEREGMLLGKRVSPVQSLMEYS